MKHDLRCLLCKIQIHCKAGDLASMRNHLKVEHDMVRYEVELMLHLCLINKREHDTIIKTLTFRLDLFVKEGLIENQVDLFQVKPKDEALKKEENALADQTDATLNETVYKSFSAEESLVTEKPAENDPLSKTDEEEKSIQIDPEVESVLNKSFVEVVVPSKAEVEVVEIEKPTTRKESLGPSEDLSLVIDDDEEDDDGVVVVKEAMNKDKEVNEAMNKGKKVNEATNEVAKESIRKTDDFDLLILTDEPELIAELKENDGKSVEKPENCQKSLGLEKKGSKCRGAVEKKSEKVEVRVEKLKFRMEDLEVRVDVARTRTRSASVKENTNKKGSSKAKSFDEKKRRTTTSGGLEDDGKTQQEPLRKITRVESGVLADKSQQSLRKITRMESGGLEEGGKTQQQPVRKMTRRRIK